MWKKDEVLAMGAGAVPSALSSLRTIAESRSWSSRRRLALDVPID
jgi:hypothetical protein